MGRAAAEAERVAPTAALLQQERARQRRARESVEQLRLELQMMARVLAAAREQIVALGGASLAPEPTLLAAPAGAVAAADGAAAAAAGAAAGAAAAAPVRQARSKGDARSLHRLQEELTESRGECKRLAEQVSTLQTKMKSMQGAKREILACCAEMSDYPRDAPRAVTYIDVYVHSARARAATSRHGGRAGGSSLPEGAACPPA